jgi:mycothiol synthase
MGKSINLPPEFTLRPATWDDLERTVAFLNDTDDYDIGKRNFSPEEFGVDWAKPGFLANSTRLVFTPDGQIIGYGEAFHQGQPPVKTIVFGRTHPQYRGLGIGTSFLKWGEAFALADLALCPPTARVFLSAQTVDRIVGARKLFENFGMKPARSYYRMKIELSEKIDSPAFPPGITVRPYRHEEDLVPLHYAYEEAFAGNWGNIPQSEKAGVAKIRGWVENNTGFDPNFWLLALEGDEIAGFLIAAKNQGEHANVSEIYELGVHPSWRRRGLGKALMLQIFTQFKRLGKEAVVLDVDADNTAGALHFYENIGMSAFTRRIAYEKTLRDGIDLREQTNG